MDYHSLPGEQNKKASSSQEFGTGYAKLAGDGASSGTFDEEPVKLTATNNTNTTNTAAQENENNLSSANLGCYEHMIPDYQQSAAAASPGL